MGKFKREHRYIVLKLSDVEQAQLGAVESAALDRIACLVDAARRRAGKPPLECVIVESDWPEYEPTWAAIRRRMTGKKEPCPVCNDHGWHDDKGCSMCNPTKATHA